MKAGTSEEAVKAGTGTRTNASVVYNGYMESLNFHFSFFMRYLRCYHI